MPRTSFSAIDAKRIGAEVRRTREKLNLTRADLASRLHVSTSYVGAVETGRANLTVGQLANLASAMQVGLDVKFIIPDQSLLESI